MGHLSISADEDVQQTLAFFEKVRTVTNVCARFLVCVQLSLKH